MNTYLYHTDTVRFIEETIIKPLIIQLDELKKSQGEENKKLHEQIKILEERVNALEGTQDTQKKYLNVLRKTIHNKYSK